jgi:hypothetical protein
VNVKPPSWENPLSITWRTRRPCSGLPRPLVLISAPTCAAMSNVMPSLTPLLLPGVNGRLSQCSPA